MPHGLKKTEEEGAWSAGVQEEVTGKEGSWIDDKGKGRR